MINKRKIIYFLIALVAALLFLNVMLGLVEKKESKVEASMNKEQIEEKFILVLHEFGIQDSWIEKQKIKKSKYDSLNYSYKIQIPSEVTIPVVLKDLTEMFSKMPIVLNSSEKKVNGITELNIKSGGYIKLIADFKYDSEISRKFSMIGFLVRDVENASEKEIKQLFDLALPIGIVLPLENNSISIAELIKKNKLDYFIELNNDADDINFEMEEDLGLEQLNVNITKIISSFNSPKVFFINELESGFNASIASFISDKFEKRGRQILTSNNYLLLKGEDNRDLQSLIQFHLNKLKPGTTKIFRISLQDLSNIQNELKKYIKKGNKIVHPSRIFNY